MAKSSSRAGNGDDFFGLVYDARLPDHHALARGEGRDDMGRLFGPLLIGAPHRLAVDGDPLGRRLSQPRRPRQKQRWNATGSSLARMMPSWLCQGVPLAKVESAARTPAWRGRSERRRPPSQPPPVSQPATKATPRRADRRLCPSADNPPSHRNATGKPSSPFTAPAAASPSTIDHPPCESEDCDRFRLLPTCHAKLQSIALPTNL
jgi:hypothetical protein